MRTGNEYRESLRDGRNVWVLGEGRVADVTTHPATAALVDAHAQWYDRHADPAWADTLLSTPDAEDDAGSWAFRTPRSADDLRRMGKSFAATLFPAAGNITHTPAYGNLIALAIVELTRVVNLSPEQIANASAYRDLLTREGRFITFCGGGSTIGYRLREDPEERPPLKLVKETDAGLVISGRLGMFTSPAFADDVYIGQTAAMAYGDKRASFVMPVNAPGVTIVSRKPAPRHENAFVSPMSHRYDELDGQMWLDETFVPWERVFLSDLPRGTTHPGAAWMGWHQLYCWLIKAEFTLGLALACVDAMGLKGSDTATERILDLLVDVQTVRSCVTAAELDPDVTPAGEYIPNMLHLSSGALSILDSRQRMAEILRGLPGSSAVQAPTDLDLVTPELSAGLEATFGGGGYSAKQRSALLQLAWEHVSSGLDGRESSFELLATGGKPTWRRQLRIHFEDYNQLANGVLATLGLEMPQVDLSHLKSRAPQPRP